MTASLADLPKKQGSDSYPGDANAAADDEKDSEGENGGKGMIVLIKDLAEKTSMQGVPNISRSRGQLRKGLWLAIVILGIFMMTYMVSEAILKYYSWPVESTTELLPSCSLPFPAVTICNLNNARKSVVQEFVNNGQYKKQAVEENYERKEPGEFFEWNKTNCEQESQEYSNMDRMLTKFAMLPQDKRHKIGHSIDWMLLTCTYQGKQCSPLNFTHFQNYLYGNCYTFNAERWSEQNGMRVTTLGPLHGLSMELYVEQYEYIDEIADAAGFRILVHNQTEMPFPEDAGVSAQPGTKTSIGINRMEVVREKRPYGWCREFSDEETIGRNAFAYELPKLKYTTAACKKTCYQQNLVRSCGCYDPRYPFRANTTTFKGYGLNETELSDVKPCLHNSHVKQKVGCMEVVDNKYKSGELMCAEYCPCECFSVEYTHSTSTSMWPANNKERAVMERLSTRSEYLYKRMSNWTEGQKKGFMRENLLKLEIYFENLDMHRVSTKASYTHQELLSELGGQAGLWLGLSIMAVFEVVELVVDIAVFVAKKCKKTSKKPWPDLSRVNRSSSVTPLPEVY